MAKLKSKLRRDVQRHSSPCRVVFCLFCFVLPQMLLGLLGSCELVTNFAYRTGWFPDASRVTVLFASLTNIQQLTRKSLQTPVESSATHNSQAKVSGGAHGVGKITRASSVAGGGGAIDVLPKATTTGDSMDDAVLQSACHSPRDPPRNPGAARASTTPLLHAHPAPFSSPSAGPIGGTAAAGGNRNIGAVHARHASLSSAGRISPAPLPARERDRHDRRNSSTAVAAASTASSAAAVHAQPGPSSIPAGACGAASAGTPTAASATLPATAMAAVGSAIVRLSMTELVAARAPSLSPSASACAAPLAQTQAQAQTQAHTAAPSPSAAPPAALSPSASSPPPPVHRTCSIPGEVEHGREEEEDVKEEEDHSAPHPTQQTAAHAS